MLRRLRENSMVLYVIIEGTQSDRGSSYRCATEPRGGGGNTRSYQMRTEGGGGGAEAEGCHGHVEKDGMRSPLILDKASSQAGILRGTE